MGYFLNLGVVTKIYIQKKIHRGKYFKEELLNQMNQLVNTSLYNVSENKDKVIFTIKEELFFEHIENLLKAELFDLEMNIKAEEGLEDFLENIKKAQHIEEIEKIMREKKCINLCYKIGNLLEPISNILEPKENDIFIGAVEDMLAYDSIENVYIDDSVALFHYLLTKIRKSIANNPLKDAISFSISSE